MGHTVEVRLANFCPLLSICLCLLLVLTSLSPSKRQKSSADIEWWACRCRTLCSLVERRHTDRNGLSRSHGELGLRSVSFARSFAGFFNSYNSCLCLLGDYLGSQGWQSAQIAQSPRRHGQKHGLCSCQPTQPRQRACLWYATISLPLLIFSSC